MKTYCVAQTYSGFCVNSFGEKILASFQNNIAAGLASYLIAVA